ncbi:sigma-54-dependent Fis family transcriptional regulator [bacterium]|nr:sigma-54-dependent Fis family transcriptional regulator [bacterium]
MASLAHYTTLEDASVMEQSPRFQYFEKYNIIGNSDAIQRVIKMIDRVADKDITILITGESGTGKELVAQAIHDTSMRSNSAFIRMNCAAVPETLVESELFGHKRGAFTGALADRNGKFLLSDKGTLFLDEVGDLSLSAQAKILRTLETGEVEMIGGETLKKVDVRIISATNHNLKALSAQGAFREDLFHRINVLEINIAPLRERPEDIPPLATFFLDSFHCEKKTGKKILAPSAVAVLVSYAWPGNVRELKNVMQKVSVLVDSEIVHSHDLYEFLGIPPAAEDFQDVGTFKKALNIFEKNFLMFSLWENDWNISRTALILGLPRSCLYDKLKKYDIKRCLAGRTHYVA